VGEEGNGTLAQGAVSGFDVIADLDQDQGRPKLSTAAKLRVSTSQLLITIPQREVFQLP